MDPLGASKSHTQPDAFLGFRGQGCLTNQSLEFQKLTYGWLSAQAATEVPKHDGRDANSLAE